MFENVEKIIGPYKKPQASFQPYDPMAFQRQGKEFKNRFPDERPVLMGTFAHENTSFLVYIHVIQNDSHEAVRFRIFRDRLSSDNELLSAYIAEKRRIISEGITDTDDYADLFKFIEHAPQSDDITMLAVRWGNLSVSK